MTTVIFNTRDLLAVTVEPHGRAGIPFLNWNIQTRPLSARGQDIPAAAFAGAGLYALSFDDRLIYLGSFLGAGSGGACLSGDVVKARWWTHIGAITARGNRMHIAKKSLAALSRSLGSEHALVSGLLQATHPDTLHKDEGNLSPLRRLRFAADRWHLFHNPEHDAAPDRLLQRFSFAYARADAMPDGLDASSLAARIASTEKALIREFAPSCNTTHVPRGMAPVELSLASITDRLDAELQALMSRP